MPEFKYDLLLPYSVYCSKKFYTFNQVSNNERKQRNFTHLMRCQTKSEAIHRVDPA